uniref:Uncharacterized protein n=1 Tax=Arundo donax TaxID=35708 RepID=A0A0A9FK74_ARUDO
MHPSGSQCLEQRIHTELEPR